MKLLQQPKAVLAVAFACVIAFMGIGLVDPILKPIADSLGATPSQTSLLFTSYMAIMGLAMLITSVVSSRLGVKPTLLLGLVIIIAGAGLAGLSDSIGAIVGYRAIWGLGNALFVATALTAIVSASSGSVRDAIIFYEAALGVGIAAGPLIGGVLGSISWRGPFFGVSVLMAIAFLVTLCLLPSAHVRPKPSSLRDPFRALKHPGLLGVALTALCYNFGFFTLLAYTPFPLNMTAHQVGLIFFGWGAMLAFASVILAPRLQGILGTIPAILFALTGFALILAIMAIWTEYKPVLVAGVVLAGLFLGINNTLVTETVMKAAPVERGVASAAYSFVRFGGGAVAPWLAGYLGETINDHVPFWVGSAAVLLGVLVLAASRRHLSHIDESHVLPTTLAPDPSVTPEPARAVAQT